MPSPTRYAAIRETPLSVDETLARVMGPSIGGVGLFVGVVRDHDHGESVSELDYTQHPSAEAELARCLDRAGAGFDGVHLAVEHRVGRLKVGDLAVVVAAGAAHRAPALEACRFLIDDLKTQVPIWKRQHLDTGVTEWVGL